MLTHSDPSALMFVKINRNPKLANWAVTVFCIIPFEKFNLNIWVFFLANKKFSLAKKKFELLGLDEKRCRAECDAD
jgi:hypothetical protein